MIVLVQLSFHTTWASLFEMELEKNLLDWNGNELELEDMKRTKVLLSNLYIVKHETNRSLEMHVYVKNHKIIR